MNPDLKNLRVAVVPIDCTNIDQSSCYDEIITCEETLYFTVPDYFKAQNDNDLPASHWSFLLDYDKKTDWTGMNVDGIDEFKKESKIARIKAIIEEWGEVTTSELELEASPIIASIGNYKNNVSQLVETFRRSGVDVVTYHGEQVIEEDYLTYLELSEELIDEIHEIMENYDTEQIKLHNSCKDENY